MKFIGVSKRCNIAAAEEFQNFTNAFTKFSRKKKRAVLNTILLVPSDSECTDDGTKSARSRVLKERVPTQATVHTELQAKLSSTVLV